MLHPKDRTPLSPQPTLSKEIVLSAPAAGRFPSLAKSPITQLSKPMIIKRVGSLKVLERKSIELKRNIIRKSIQARNKIKR
jgi:hypothetical protein